MKVGDAISLVPAQAAPRATGTATTSFATLLASGKSVSAIRSERAFGFSETGLLGATRATEVNGAASVRPPTIEASELPKPQATQSPSLDSRQARPAPGTVATGSGRSDVVITERTFIPPGARGTQPLAANYLQQIRTDSQSRYSKTLHRNLPIITADRRFPLEKWQRRLSLSGPDDALSISIHEFSNEEHQESELFFIFSSVTRQFGVTLRFIRLHMHGFNLKLESGRV